MLQPSHGESTRTSLSALEETLGMDSDRSSILGKKTGGQVVDLKLGGVQTSDLELYRHFHKKERKLYLGGGWGRGAPDSGSYCTDCFMICFPIFFC